ncbi:MAG: alkaline phosphatase family protein [Anaerolineae bacterium]|nr:alkaline phosphatase family protein [Anaerolineae bacterium]
MSWFTKWFEKKEKSTKLVVIGLDGTPYTFVERMLRAGRMPNLAQITQNAGFARMNSVYPTVSSVAWSCYMTGVNPAQHGIYGFTDRKPGSYDVIIPNAQMMRAKTLWEVFSEAGKRVIVINVPVTYPPRAMNGILIGGFLSPKLDRAVYPPEKTDLIKSLGYRIDTDAWLARESKDKLFADVQDCLARRRKTLLHLMDNEAWDFFQCHIMETDRLYHFAWEQYETDDPVYAPPFYETIRQIDDLLGEVLKRVEKAGAELMVLSDHGFCTLKYEVYINTWLEQKGWLTLPDPKPERIQLNHVGPTSRVYSLDPGRIFVNLQGREPNGIVPQAEYEMWRDRIVRAAMQELLDPETGEPMLEKVLRREEIYHGSEFARAADLILVPRDGYDLKGAFGKESLTFRGAALVGMHTYDDAMIAIHNRPIAREGFGIVDVTATTLKLMQVDPPEGLDSQTIL